ncbi:MAG: phosphohistidine phosphatase SixA [Ignavibacteriae bacterium]|nr:phosphohistidine phosphatase SixA [Ignavibacteriota bacterium]
MKLYLIRHTEAIDYETESVRSDEHRFITPKGRRIAINVFKMLKDEMLDLEKIFTSPIVRSVQTAEILAITVKYKNDVEIANELTLASSPEKVLQLLRRNSIFKSIALVGHEPMMSTIVRNFTDKKDPEFALKKASVCFINMDLDKGTGKFEWYLNPKTSEFQK